MRKVTRMITSTIAIPVAWRTYVCGIFSLTAHNLAQSFG